MGAPVVILMSPLAFAVVVVSTEPSLLEMLTMSPGTNPEPSRFMAARFEAALT
jgi:hypothetical protein